MPLAASCGPSCTNRHTRRTPHLGTAHTWRRSPCRGSTDNWRSPSCVASPATCSSVAWVKNTEGRSAHSRTRSHPHAHQSLSSRFDPRFCTLGHDQHTYAHTCTLTPASTDTCTCLVEASHPSTGPHTRPVWGADRASQLNLPLMFLPTNFRGGQLLLGSPILRSSHDAASSVASRRLTARS